MIRLIIEFSYIQNLSFLWLHPSLLLFAAWIIQLDVWGLKWGAQSILSCYFRDTGAKLDLCFFFLDCCHRTFQDYSKKGLPSLSFFETIKSAFFSPQKTDIGGQGENAFTLAVLQQDLQKYPLCVCFFLPYPFLHFSVRVTISNH